MVMLNAETTRSEDDISGRSRPEPGRYHVAVQHAEEKGSKKKGTPGLELEFQVIVDGLASDGKTHTAGQSGKTIPLFLSYVGGDDAKTKTCLDRVLRLALCCGVIRPGESREPDWSEAIGRELVIEVEPGEKYEDDKGNERAGLSQVSFLGFWSLGNAAVANVPKDATSPGMQQLAKAGGPVNHPAAGNGGNGTKAPASAATAAPSKSKWADL